MEEYNWYIYLNNKKDISVFVNGNRAFMLEFNGDAY